MPSVSFLVRTPFSKHSMAKAITVPAEIGSSPARLQMALAMFMASALPLPHITPKLPWVSYSGRRLPAAYLYSPVPSLMTALQAMGQCQQPLGLSTLESSKSASNPDTSGTSTTPTPPQFLTGVSPLWAELRVMPLVPYLCHLSMKDMPPGPGAC